MQPVVYSTKDAADGLPGWERVGTNVAYYKNYFLRRGQGSNKYHYSATFTITFPYTNDVCYVAYHYPYSYSLLKVI